MCHATSIGPTSTRASTSVSSSEQADSSRSQARSPTDPQVRPHDRPPAGRDADYLLELPEFVEVTELHVNDWQLGAGSRR
jgi:hypothetical protein